MDDGTPHGEVTDLLRSLIVNACVNEGTDESGHEVRNADLLASYLDVPGIEIEKYEPLPGRASIVARIEGTGGGPTLGLLGHTDVVPVDDSQWTRDPFGGELVDGWVWGRGAVDMLNLTASMAVAMRHLASRAGPPLRGTLELLAVADEENLGTHGAKWLTDTQSDRISCDWIVTEAGGIPVPTPSGIRLPVLVGEKGEYWSTLRVSGRPGHGSQPYGVDNALVKAAEIVRRLATHRYEAMIPDLWREFLNGLEIGGELTASLTDEGSVDDACASLPEGFARQAHACTHMTVAPTVFRSGSKINVIPGTAEVNLDIRTLPGQTEEEVRAVLFEAIGDLATSVELVSHGHDAPTQSPTDTDLWRALSTASQRFYEGSRTVPMLSVGATDARFFRRHGTPAYGFGLFSRQMTFEQFGTMFHGNDERVDVESLVLSTRLWEEVAAELLA